MHRRLHGVDGKIWRKFQLASGGTDNDGGGSCLEPRRKQRGILVADFAVANLADAWPFRFRDWSGVVVSLAKSLARTKPIDG